MEILLTTYPPWSLQWSDRRILDGDSQRQLLASRVALWKFTAAHASEAPHCFIRRGEAKSKALTTRAFAVVSLNLPTVGSSFDL